MGRNKTPGKYWHDGEACAESKTAPLQERGILSQTAPLTLPSMCATCQIAGIVFFILEFCLLEGFCLAVVRFFFKENLLQHPEQLFKLQTKITRKQEMGSKEFWLILLKNKYSLWTQECWVKCCARSTTKDAKHISELSQGDTAALWAAPKEHHIPHSLDLRKLQWDHAAKSIWKQEDDLSGTMGLSQPGKTPLSWDKS